MRVLVPLIALVLTAAAGPPQSGGRPQMGELRVPSGPGEAVCRDRIQEVRDERGLPRLDRETASPDEALLIAAVDKRIGGCSVMVMRNDTSDIRPLPAPQEHRMMPAR
jgi:hypothetical protein